MQSIEKPGTESVPELEFKSRSVTYRVEHGSIGSEETIYISLQPDVETNPVKGSCPAITLDKWSLTITADATEVDEFSLPGSVGRAKRLLKNVVAVNIQLPPTRFNALSRAVLSGAPLRDVAMEVDGLVESDSELLWPDPDEPINISSISLAFSCATSGI